MPLALDAQRQFDRVRQRALIRYYVDSGVGGIAVGVHSTQFEIRDVSVGLFEPVLEFASDAIDSWCAKKEKAVLKIAGVAGRSDQARSEAEFALKSGYHACLLSLGAFGDDPESTLIDHARIIAEIIPVIGFYLQPSVGGRELSFDFFREFAQIENVFGIKIAPFDRYKTIDVVRGVVEAKREIRLIKMRQGQPDSSGRKRKPTGPSSSNAKQKSPVTFLGKVWAFLNKPR